MSLPRFRFRLSTRFSLTLWGVGILGIALLALGVAVRLTVRAYLMASIDRDLASRTSMFPLRGKPPFGPPPGERRSLHRDGTPYSPFASSPDRFATNWLFPETDNDLFRPGRPGKAMNKQDEFGPRLFDRFGKVDRPSDPAWDTQAVRTAIATGEPVFSTREYKGERLRVCTVPLRRDKGGVEGVVQIPLRLAEIDRGLVAVDRTLLMLLPLALVVTVSGGVLLTNRAIQPIERALEQEKRFVADASHELRTPIAIIRAATELGREAAEQDSENAGPILHRALSRIDLAAQRTQRIVEDLMLLARAERAVSSQDNRLESSLFLNKVPLSVQELLTEAVTLFDPIRAGRVIEVDVVPSDMMIAVDSHHLGRVLSNLIDNAVRHTAPESGVITLTARPAPGDHLTLTVSDNGEGIPRADLPLLFNRFYRPDASRTRARGGAGLGLAIAKAVVEAHGGTIEIESSLGNGTCICLTLPEVSSARF